MIFQHMHGACTHWLNQHVIFWHFFCVITWFNGLWLLVMEWYSILLLYAIIYYLIWYWWIILLFFSLLWVRHLWIVCTRIFVDVCFYCSSKCPRLECLGHKRGAGFILWAAAPYCVAALYEFQGLHFLSRLLVLAPSTLAIVYCIGQYFLRFHFQFPWQWMKLRNFSGYTDCFLRLSYISDQFYNFYEILFVFIRPVANPWEKDLKT